MRSFEGEEHYKWLFERLSEPALGDPFDKFPPVERGEARIGRVPEHMRREFALYRTLKAAFGKLGKGTPGRHEAHLRCVIADSLVKLSLAELAKELEKPDLDMSYIRQGGVVVSESGKFVVDKMGGK